MLSRDTRNERKLKLLLRSQFRFKQAIERIDFEEDVLIPKINEYKAKAQLPELPSELAFDVDYDDDVKPPKAQPVKRDSRKGK